MATLYLDDYFSGGELNVFVAQFGWEIYDREWTAISTYIKVEVVDDYDAVALDELVVRISDHFNVHVAVQ